MTAARRINPRRQGDLGEAAAIAWLTKVGAGVFVPLFHSPDYDLIAELRGTLLRVQVKTSRRQRGRRRRFSVQLATSGGNQSWNGLVKRFDVSRCDFLFALVADGRRWFIPADAVEAERSITLGGPKYSEFEIDREGAPAFSLWRALESLEVPGERRSGRAGPDCKSGALLLSGFDSHLPHPSAAADPVPDPEIAAGTEQLSPLRAGAGPRGGAGAS